MGMYWWGFWTISGLHDADPGGNGIVGAQLHR